MNKNEVTNEIHSMLEDLDNLIFRAEMLKNITKNEIYSVVVLEHKKKKQMIEDILLKVENLSEEEAYQFHLITKDNFTMMNKIIQYQLNLFKDKINSNLK